MIIEKFKKGIKISLLLFSSPSFGWCEYYLGFGIGPENANFKQQALIIGRPPSTNFRTIDKTHFSGRGGFGSVFAGYGMTFSFCDPCKQDLYLAAEINANLRRLKFKSTNEEFINVNFNHTYYQMHRDFGISLLPGFLFSDCTLLYARLGYGNGKFSVDTTDPSLQNIRKNLNSFRYGLGFRQAINDSGFALRIECSQNNYQKTKMVTFDALNNVAKTTTITAYAQRFELALVYAF